MGSFSSWGAAGGTGHGTPGAGTRSTDLQPWESPGGWHRGAVTTTREGPSGPRDEQVGSAVWDGGRWSWSRLLETTLGGGSGFGGRWGRRASRASVPEIPVIGVQFAAFLSQTKAFPGVSLCNSSGFVSSTRIFSSRRHPSAATSRPLLV